MKRILGFIKKYQLLLLILTFLTGIFFLYVKDSQIILIILWVSLVSEKVYSIIKEETTHNKKIEE